MPPKIATKRPRPKASDERHSQSLVTLTRRNLSRKILAEGGNKRFSDASVVRCKSCEALRSATESQHSDVAVSDLAENMPSSCESLVFGNCPVVAVLDTLLAPLSSSKGACDNEEGSDTTFSSSFGSAAPQQKAAITVAGKEIKAITYGPAIAKSYASEGHLYATEDIGESHGVGLLGGIFVDNDRSVLCGNLDKKDLNEAKACCKRCRPSEEAFFTKRCDLNNLYCRASSSAKSNSDMSKGATVDNSADFNVNNPACASYAFVPAGWSVPTCTLSPSLCTGTSSLETYSNALCTSNSSRVLHTLATKPRADEQQQREGRGGPEEEERRHQHGKTNARPNASHLLSIGGLVEDASSSRSQEDCAIATITDMPAERAMQLLRLASSAGKRLVLVGVSSLPSHHDHDRHVVEGLVLEYTDQL